LEEAISSALSSTLAFTRRPGFSPPMREPPTRSAARGTRTVSSASKRSTASSAVMIFVRLAIGRTAVARCRHRIVPSSKSNARPAFGPRLRRR
jgi:hypothetical protein